MLRYVRLPVDGVFVPIPRKVGLKGFYIVVGLGLSRNRLVGHFRMQIRQIRHVLGWQGLGQAMFL